MSGIHDSLNRADLQLLHEALAYARKRTFLPADSVRLQGVLDRVEELLLDSVVASSQTRTTGSETPPRPPSLRLSPPEQVVLRREILAYCEVLTGRGASLAGAGEARRLYEILDIITGRRRRWRWLRRLFGAFGRRSR